MGWRPSGSLNKKRCCKSILSCVFVAGRADSLRCTYVYTHQRPTDRTLSLSVQCCTRSNSALRYLPTQNCPYNPDRKAGGLDRNLAPVKGKIV